MNRLSIIFLGVLFMACNEPKTAITNPSDYNQYLTINASENEKLSFLQNELSFWSDKFESAPNQSTYLSKMAAANNQLFELTGSIENLRAADEQLAEANELRGNKSSSLLRALAKTRITQHRFKEANEALIEALALGEQRSATEKMLFDVAMELGNYKAAKIYLDKISQEEDFDYLIRLAKWYDYKGDTAGAIVQLNLALQKAEELKSDDLKLWLYSNLGDFYGHVGEIEKSYRHYLKALSIDNHYVYALKGIAWINYSHEKNTTEAERIISVLEKKHAAPDYKLMRSEIAKFKGDTENAERLKAEYISQVSDEAYGDMYNAYLVTLLGNEPSRALVLAKKEVANRPTPSSYQLLSWALSQNGQNSEALKIAEEKVKNRTFEPKSLLQLAEVYKASGKTKEVKELKSELEGSYFEVGPNMAKTIQTL